MISGTTTIFFMIAHPIAHVRTPEVINPLFEVRGIDAVVVPAHYHPDAFEAGWEGLRHIQNLGGVVVSVPLKEAAFRLSDMADDTAREIGAANAVRRTTDGRFVCANFDGPGFTAGVMNGGRDVIGRHVLLVGAGGGGSSIAFALAKAGAASIRIADLDGKRAERLVVAVRQRHPNLDVRAGPPDPAGRNLIINATPCGLYPETDPLPVDVNKLTPDMIVADIVMKPVLTPLLAAAERAGCAVRFGAGMLDSQAELMMRFFGY